MIDDSSLISEVYLIEKIGLTLRTKTIFNMSKK